MQAQTGQSFQRRDGPTGFEPTNSNNLHIQWKINEQPYERFPEKSHIDTDKQIYQRKQKGDGPDCEGIRILALLSSFRQYYSLFAGIIECNGTCLFLHEKTH